MITAHIDRQHTTIDGVDFKNTHSGQKKAYGDSFYEYVDREQLACRRSGARLSRTHLQGDTEIRMARGLSQARLQHGRCFPRPLHVPEARRWQILLPSLLPLYRLSRPHVIL